MDRVVGEGLIKEVILKARTEREAPIGEKQYRQEKKEKGLLQSVRSPV